MTTLSRVFENTATRDSAARWAAWQAKGAARDAEFRRQAVHVFWMLCAAALFAAVAFLGIGV
jgi:hypothetical protein